MPSINLNTITLICNLLNWQQGNWPIVGGKWGVPFIQQVGRIRMIRRFPQRTRTCISAHLHWDTEATRRTSSKITESGLDLGDKRGWRPYYWGVFIIPCVKWSKVITIIQAETRIFIDTMWVRTVWRWKWDILGGRRSDNRGRHAADYSRRGIHWTSWTGPGWNWGKNCNLHSFLSFPKSLVQELINSAVNDWWISVWFCKSFSWLSRISLKASSKNVVNVILAPHFVLYKGSKTVKDFHEVKWITQNSVFTLKGLCHHCLGLLYIIANYLSLFTMELEILLVSDKIQALCQHWTKMFHMHFKPYKTEQNDLWEN